MNYIKQNRNENSHPALKIFKCWVPQFCIFNFDFCILKLTNQFESFMQNKPNLPAPQINVNTVITREYKNKSNWKLGENKPNTKPIQTQFPKCPNEPKYCYNKVL